MSILLEEQRLLHEDIERLEQATAERILEDPRNNREHLRRDHQMANFLDRIQSQSKRLLDIYADSNGERTRQVQAISTGDIFEEFYKEYKEIKSHHKEYPNEAVENLERAYKRRPGEPEPMAPNIESMFTGEEGFGRFFDMTTLHDAYENLPGNKNAKHSTYLQYLDTFDNFAQLKRPNKMTDAYFRYLGDLVSYLEGFMRKTRPLEDLDRLFAEFDEEFAKAWEANEIPGWEDEDAAKRATAGPVTEGSGSGYWCADCQKEFQEHTYKPHLNGRKHKRAAAERAATGGQAGDDQPSSNGAVDTKRLKERAVAQREFSVKKLAAAMKLQRGDTRVNVERRQGMTERERQQELDSLYAEGIDEVQEGEGEEEGDEDKIYNPLKLPLAWDGKPIPFWLYKLHGLGVEFPCEVCGNFVYMGRRAFDKHFTEGRHLYGLKCLGITKDTGLYREITGIQDAINLHKKIEVDKKKQKQSQENVVQMEDAAGNVMPEKVYYDLQKQGLL
ncbi:splicing factor 3a subunit 3 [Diplodia corticola]|uniref:Splicing factor 3a subunit 3 n=1 Tax=Diplodia corticola TaxID=236234 RepID=A0A1J9S0F1_9PEZI|nr:splicing factor 3a subunit 3 [Diplodia corticola]OJD33500.1 splicing factor 3a subunit 3 [Diplodia corticola]